MWYDVILCCIMLNNHFTVEEVAEIFKYNPQTIRRLIRMGRIHAFRLGNGKKAPYRIVEEEIERLRVIGFQEQMEELKRIRL